MDFNWKESEKEKFYQIAERQLEEAGIDFIKVDRSSFGVRRWDEKKKTVQAVIITLEAYSYGSLNRSQRSRLKKLKNWECMDRFRQGESKPVFMHSRLIITDF